MGKKDKIFHPGKSTLPDTLPESEPWSLKDNPDGETICHADFSGGCVNEDTDASVTSEKEDKNEKY